MKLMHEGIKSYFGSYLIISPTLAKGGQGGFFGKDIIHKISPPPLFQRGDEFISYWNRVP
jgi:hypothetical protein